MEWTKEQRDKLEAGEIEGAFAGPDQSYPIAGPDDVNDAWRLAGQADNPNAIRRAILRIAKKFGWESGLPKTAQAFSAAVDQVMRDSVSKLTDPRKELNYTDVSPITDDSINCSTCRFFATDSCLLIPGEISPEGWCELYTMFVDEFDEQETYSLQANEEIPPEPQAETEPEAQSEVLSQLVNEPVADQESEEDEDEDEDEDDDEEILSLRFSDNFDEELESFAVSLTKEDKDPDGGLTASGRKKYNKAEGSNLKPGVKGTPRTQEDFRRKGSFLTRFYTDPSGPLVNDKGELTRLAKAACLHKSTPVLLADGTFKDIGEIVDQRLPVEVVCFDFETNDFTTATVSNWLKCPSSLREFVAVDDLTIVTSDHLILTTEGWKAAADIEGDERAIYSEGSLDFAPTQLVRPKVEDCEFKYDIEVPIHHNFVAFRTVVHNSAWGETPPRTVEQAHKLAAKGRRLLERAKEMRQNMSINPELPVDETSVEQPSPEPKEQPDILTSDLFVLSNGMVKVPLAKKGSWKHEHYGVVEFNDKDFEDMKRNFERNVLGFTPYLTFGHDLATIENPNAVDGQLKKGELLSILEEGDVLWGLFNPKTDARQYVESGEYEYNSPEVIRNYVDKDTGEIIGTTLIRSALTNSPFIPFNDIKVEALSLSENRPLSGIPFMVKVNVESPESGTNSMTEPTPQVETFDKEEFKAEIQQMFSTFTAEIQELKAENESLKQELVDTKTRQESFSNLYSQQEEAYVLSQMTKAGVSPAFIQRFSALKNELVQAGAASRPIALSVSGKEVVRPLINEVAHLLVDAIHASPEEAVVETQQLGVSSGDKPSGTNDWLKKRAQEVLAKAKKQSAE